MHNVQQRQRLIPSSVYKQELAKCQLGDNVANHMGYIFTAILYDKFDMTFKQVTNFYSKTVERRKSWQDDDDETVTSESMMAYCRKKKIDVVKWVKSIPMSQKLYMADIKNVLSESLLHLLLWLIFRQIHPNFINVRTAYASKIRAHLTKNLLIKSSTKRFREYIKIRRRISHMADTQEKKVCPCCTKHTMRSEEERKKLINRLKRVEGQIRGIIGMLENDAYCNDILIQSAAVNAAVNAFNKELLASHIRNCVARDIRQGKDETIDELVVTLQKLMK